MRIRASRPGDAARVIDIWARAVDATHHFLDPGDRWAIEAEVRDLLPAVPLWLAVDAAGRVLGFALVAAGRMEALFVDPAAHRRGAGTLLVRHALARHPNLELDVNAQNGAALGFYRALGFGETGRSPVDTAGRPYPLVHLRHPGRG